MTRMNQNRAGVSAQSQAAVYDEGLRQYMLGIYNNMTFALAITALVAFIAGNYGVAEMFYSVNETTGRMSMNGLGWIAALSPLPLVLFLSARLHSMESSSARLAFFGFAALMGLSLCSIFLFFTGESIVRTLVVTMGAFAGLSLYGYTTKKDLTAMGSFLIMGVWGLVLASLANIFIGSSSLHFAVSLLGVGIFAGLTAYDTQKLRRMYYELGGNAEMAGRVAIMGALSLYLDFINMFQFLLQFMGNRE